MGIGTLTDTVGDLVSDPVVSDNYFSPGLWLPFQATVNHCFSASTILYCLVSEACVWTTCPESLHDGTDLFQCVCDSPWLFQRDSIVVGMEILQW